MLNTDADEGLSKPLIAIDLDDVIFDCNRTLQVIILKEFEFSGTYSDFIKVNPHLASAAFGFLYGEYHQGSSYVTGAFEAISNLAVDYEIVIITARSETVKRQTIEWLEDKFPRVFSGVYFTNSFLATPSEASVEKHEICRKLEISTIIEDSHNVAVSVVPYGIRVLLMDKPWNRGVPEHSNIYRVKDWEDVSVFLSKTN